MNLIASQLKKHSKFYSILGALFISLFFFPISVSADVLSVSCSPNPSNPYTGDNVTFYANASGGNGNYTYSWTGTDGLSGTGSTVTRTYYALGQQSATVTVNSNGITQSATCYVNVTQRPYYGGGYNSNYGRLSATCLAIPTTVNTGENVNWMVQNVTGGNGNYTYSWTGTDGLSSTGQTAYKSYSYGGTKNASVNITSGDGQVFSANCSPIFVSGNPYGNNSNYYGNNSYNYNGSLGVSCYATPNQANMYDSVTWYANVTGGNGYYTYTWTGTDGLSGTGQNISRMYSSIGQKVANVTVYSNGQSVTNSCTMNVGSTYSYNNTYYNPGNTYYPSNNTYYPPLYPSNFYTNPQTTSFVQAPAATTYTSSQYSNPVAGVYLSQLPSTGISFSMKMILFTLGLIMWSLFMAYMFIQRKNNKLAHVGIQENSLSQSERIEAFKKANLLKKRIK